MTITEAERKIADIAALQANWDTYNAPPFTADEIDAGLMLVRRCFHLGAVPDRVVPGDGAIVVYFWGQGKRSADIEAHPDGLLACTNTGEQGGVEIWDVTDVDATVARVMAFVRAQ